MHVNEKEPQEADISLQTYMHIQRERERGGRANEEEI